MVEIVVMKSHNKALAVGRSARTSLRAAEARRNITLNLAVSILQGVEHWNVKKR